MVSLNDKLKALGVKMGGDGLPKAKKKNVGRPIHELLPQGRVISTTLGESFAVEELYSSTYQHGKHLTFAEADYTPLLQMLSMDEDFDLYR